MSNNLTLHTGTVGDENRIEIDWFDQNNVHQTTVIEANIKDQDKPRELEIWINGKYIATTISNEGKGLERFL